MTTKIPPKPAPKPSKDVIYVDVDDEITGIIDKLENSSHKVVALVLPKRAASLQSIVNMKLLARSAETAGKSPVLITSEAALLPLAGVAGLHVAKNLQSKPEVPDAPAGRPHASTKKAEEPEEEAIEDQADDDKAELPEKIDYSSPVGALVAAHDDESDTAIDLDDESAEDSDTPAPKASKKAKDKDKKLKVPNFDRFRMLLGLGVLAIIGLIVFVIFALTVLPKAKITIQTSSESVSANFAVAASSDTTTVDPAKNTMPAKLETMDQTGTQQVTATGSQNTGDKAAGTVSMTAKECAPSLGTPDDVPSGSGISSGGVSFITQSKTSFSLVSASGSCVNYAATSSTPIKAVAPGAKYNLSSGSVFSVRSDITASGSSTGGTDNIATVLSQADVDAAKDKLTAGTTANTFTKTFEDKLAAQGEYVLTSTLKAGDPSINATPAVGQPASTANVTIKITYTVLALKKIDLSQLIEAKMAGQIDSKKQKLTGNFLNDASIAVQSQGAPNSAQISISEDTSAVPIIDTNTVKKQAEGKKAGDIQSTINNWPGVKNVDVSLGPFWVSKVPKKPGKITVVLQEVKASSSDSKP